MATDETETLDDATRTALSEGKFWADQIRLADKTERDWRQAAEGIVDRYRGEHNRGEHNPRAGAKFNILWSNVQLLKPATYARPPVPDVRRRELREEAGLNTAGRQVAEALERALEFAVDDEYFDTTMKRVRDDYLIPGRGTSRLRYVPTIVRRPVEADPVSGMVPPDAEFDEDGAAFVEEITDERVVCEHVFWSDFRMSPARSWDDVWWVSFRHAMNRKELGEEFGPELAREIPLQLSADASGDQISGGDKGPPDPSSPFSRAEVWEIWDKRKRERIWIATGFDRIIRKDVDPLGLENFFPCPKPLTAIETTDKMVPVPEFEIYRDQADELDEIADRLRSLVAMVKAVNFVDGDFVEATSIRATEDGTNIAITSPGTYAQELGSRIWPWPVQNVVQTIITLNQRFEEVKAEIFELIGISDLMRQQTKERESAAAQRLKTQFGTVRMTPRSAPMAEYIRDVLRLKAEVMAEMFQPETLQRISGVTITPDVMQLLREERLRNTVISVATDSTVAPDQHQEKQDAVEFLTSVAQYLSSAAPLVQAAPAMAPLLLAMLREAAATFKFSRKVEQQIEQLVPVAEQTARQPPAQASNGAGNGAGSQQPRNAE